MPRGALVVNRQKETLKRCLFSSILGLSTLSYCQDTQVVKITGSWKLYKILQLDSKCSSMGQEETGLIAVWEPPTVGYIWLPKELM